MNERDHYVPLCESDGSYKQIQCNSATGECWCVDGDGREKEETRKIGKPICDSQGMSVILSLIVLNDFFLHLKCNRVKIYSSALDFCWNTRNASEYQLAGQI